MEKNMYEIYNLPNEKIIQLGHELARFSDENRIVDEIYIDKIIDGISHENTHSLARMNIIVLVEKFKDRLNGTINAIVNETPLN